MAKQWWRKVEPPHPAAALAATGVLLFGLHLSVTIRSAQQARGASYPSSALTATAQDEVAPVIPGLTVPLAGPAPVPDPAEGNDPAPAAGAGATAASPAPTVRTPPSFIGPELPVRGPQWQGAPLPSLSPDVLQAMLDPRAVRRARRLRQQGIVPSTEPDPRPAGGPAPAPGQVAGPPTPRSSSQEAPAAGDRRAETPKTAAAGAPAQSQRSLPVAQAERPATAPAAAGESGEERRSATTAPAAPKPAGEAGTGGANPKPAVENPPSPLRPISLQAHPDRPQLQYRQGEWVALRYSASHPAHLRVYRVNATGQVARVFSTYGREEGARPARSFSLMLKAGEPRPGQERVIAIGSARPLTQEELLACLRDYLAEGPFESLAPAAEAPVAPTHPGTGDDPPPLADALQAVIAAVGRASDMPGSAPVPLERSAWAVTVGRFMSNPRRAAQAPPTGAPAPVNR